MTGIRLFTSGISRPLPEGPSVITRIKKTLSLPNFVPYDLIVLPQNSATRGAIEEESRNRGLEMKKVLEGGRVFGY